MRKKYKNEIFHQIKELGFTPEDFTLLEDSEDECNAFIKYRDTPFLFTITNSRRSFDEFECQFVLYGPGFPESELFPDRDYSDFSSVLNMFNYWVKGHIKEYELDEFEPDLWSEYKSGNTFLNFNEIDFNDKDLFSLHEKKQILMSINELKLLINSSC